MKNQIGQIAIFVVMGVILVGATLLILLLRNNAPPIKVPFQETDPQAFMQQCIRDETTAHIDKLIPRAGISDPLDYVSYKGIRVPYLCKNINHYEPCIVQEPVLLQTIRHNLENELRPPIEQCLSRLTEELTRKSYVVEQQPVENLIVTLRSGLVSVDYNVQIDIQKEADSQHYDSFKVRVNSPLYDLAQVAQEIIGQESTFCYFSTDGFSLLNPQTPVVRDVLSDSSKVYRIDYKSSTKSMYLAIRGCALPAGY